MKIIQIITAFKPGGGEVMCQHLCCGLQELGHEVMAVSLESYHSEITEKLEKKGIRIVYLDKKPGMDISMPKKIYEIFKLEQPDVVHMHIIRKSYVVPAAKKVGVPVLFYTVHNMADKEQLNLEGLYSRFLFRRQDVIPVGLTPLVTQSIIDRYGVQDIPTIGNGVDLSQLIVKKSYRLSDPPVILNVARLWPQKNHERLLESFARVHSQFPKVRLRIIGAGDLMDFLIHKTKELKLDSVVEFVGQSHEISKEMHDADIFCLSSDYEGMPMILIEAMGTGIPIVTTNVGGVSDMLGNQDALLCPTDAMKLAEAMISLLEDETKRKMYGTHALQTSSKFSYLTMAQSYVSAYELRLNI